MGTSKAAIDSIPSFLQASPYRDTSHEHTVQFYAEDSFLVDMVSRFVGTALGAGDVAVVIATKAHRDGVAARLKSRGLDVSKAAQQGRYAALDAGETLTKFMVDGFPDTKRFVGTLEPVLKAVKAAGGDDSKTVAFGEMVALLWGEQKLDAAIRLEQLWNELAKKHSFTLHCAYPMAEFHRVGDEGALSRICAEHSTVMPSEKHLELDDQEQLRNVARLEQMEQAHEALQKANERLEREMGDRRVIEHRLMASEESLRQLSGHILRTQDEERRRIGLDLHDSVGQYLAVLQMQLDALAAESKDTKTAAQLADCVNLVEESLREIRTMSYLLYPPMLEEMGLRSAIPWYLDGFTKRSGIRTSFEISPGLLRFARQTELAIFRVVQESLTNIHRHSGSGVAQVLLLLEGDKVRLEVRDKGKGFSPETLTDFCQGSRGSLTLGLRGMNERVRQFGGNLELFSGSEGATVVATLPLVKPNGHQETDVKHDSDDCELIYPD
jgi:signal transduction histidine kinase